MLPLAHRHPGAVELLLCVVVAAAAGYGVVVVGRGYDLLNAALREEDEAQDRSGVGEPAHSSDNPEDRPHAV